MSSGSGPTKQERRDEARRTRLAREQADANTAARNRRLRLLGAIVAVAVVIVAVVIVATSGGGGGSSSTPASSGTNGTAASPSGAGEVTSLLSGIPQRDRTLGQASAPVRVIEFADPQCPFCRDFALGQLPTLLRDQVRPGRVRLEYRTLAFIGADSEKAARFIEAAGLQDRMWYATELLYANQGAENSGWVTDALLRSIAGAIPGLDANKVFSDAASPAVTARLRANERLATQRGVQSTPTFLVGTGTSLRAVGADQLNAAIKSAEKAS
jgi:protein-disulfide isomerase